MVPFCPLRVYGKNALTRSDKKHSKRLLIDGSTIAVQQTGVLIADRVAITYPVNVE